MKVDMQKPIPRKKRVSRGKIYEKPRIDDVLLVPVDEKSREVAELQQRRVREGTRQLNDLETKADELEKLFAEHKLRSASVWRRRPSELPSATTGGNHVRSASDRGSLSREGLSLTSSESNSGTAMEIPNGEGHRSGHLAIAGDFDCSNNSKGKHYDKYMELRDAKLEQDRRSSKGAVKDAQLRAMEEQLHNCRALMEAGLGGSSKNYEGRDPRGSTRLNNSNTHGARATVQNKQQESECWKIEAGENDNEGLGTETDQSGSACGMLSDSPKDQRSNNLLSGTDATSSVPPAPAKYKAAAAARPISSSQGRLRTSSENLLVRSAPTTMYPRKENGLKNVKTKPTTKSNHMHNKSASGSKIGSVQDDRAAKQRKSSASDAADGLNDLASDIPDDSTVVATLPQEKPEYKRTLIQNVERRPFLRKGKGVGPGSGPAAMAKLKASMAQENLESKEQLEGCPVVAEGSSALADHEEEVLKTDPAEESLGADADDGVDEENNVGLIIISNDSGESPSSGNVLELSPETQVTSPLAITTTSKETSSGMTTMPESPVESPAFWDSDLHHSFAYAPRASDVDAFVDSPVDSWVSGSFRHSDQITGSDAAWTRTDDTGMAHNKPLLAGGTARRTKMNIARGWKRLLKLGMKSKVGEGSTVVSDWASSSANSGVDNDTEDSCDQASRTSDATYKSTDGRPQYHSGNGDTNSREISKIQAPRSFFFLPTFRSRGSKARA